jgi:hypothetical protein
VHVPDHHFSHLGTHERVDLDVRQIFVSLAAPSTPDHVLQVYSSLTNHMWLGSRCIGPKNAFNTAVVGCRSVAACQRVSPCTATLSSKVNFARVVTSTLMITIWF